MVIALKNTVTFRKLFNVTNSLCLLSAIALFIIGFIYMFELDYINTPLNDQDLTTLQYIAIVFGFFLILDTIFGFIVVHKSIVNMLKVYCVTVPTINIMVLIAFFVVNIHMNIVDAFDTIWRTRNVPENQVAVNHIQSRFLCCGFNGSTGYSEFSNLPKSCCPTSVQITTCTYTFAYKDGCFKYVDQWAHEVWGAFGATILGLGLSGLVSFGIAVILMKAEYRRTETIILS